METNVPEKDVAELDAKQLEEELKKMLELRLITAP